MPGGGPDLGFLAIAIVLAAAILLSVRRRWRAAVARAEEVRRLAWLAAEETARAEAEAVALAHAAPPAPSSLAPEGGGGGSEVGDWAARPPTEDTASPKCAVCYRHTTTRCSRCKAVRYCSGKCQIIHWRKGHKDECHPPSTDDENNNGKRVSNSESVPENKSNLSENIVDTETKAQAKPVEISSLRASGLLPEDDHVEVEQFVDVSGTVDTSDSSGDSSSSSLTFTCSTYSCLLKTSDEASSNDNPHTYGKMEKSSCDTLFEDTTAAVDTRNINLKASANNTASSHHNVPIPKTSKEKVHNKTDDAGYYTEGASGSSFMCSTDARPPEGDGKSESCSEVDFNHPPSDTRAAKKESSSGIAPSEGIPRSRHGTTTSMGPDNSRSVASRRTDVMLQKDKTSRSSSLSSLDPACANGKIHSVSCDMSTYNDNTKKSAGTTASVQNGASDFRTSVRKVVQQLKPSHVVKHSFGSRSDASRKNKMLFPYDVFVKLYNCEKVEMHPCGLTNCGNSCYANAVLQCLAFTRPLMSYLLQGLHAKICPRKDWCFTCEFTSLLVKSKQGQSPLSPIGILSHIHKIGSNLGHGREEDAHEFLRYAIETMQSVCLKEAGINAGTSAEETTLIQLIFGGYLRSKIKCTRCRGTSERHERMMDLTVEIYGDIGTLEDALARFTATEILDGENKYHCGRCKGYERAKKKLTVLEAPNVLTIALKRFQSGKFGKLNKAVRFPETLDLAPYMSTTEDKSPVYSLYAVVVHQDIMNAAFSGHYVCYVKSTQGKWYKTDDSKVKMVDIGRILTQNAYMLFYARCSPRAPSLMKGSVSHDHLKPRKSKDSVLSSHRSSSVTQRQRSHDHPPRQLHDHRHSTNERLPFPWSETSSDSSSIFSCSDEASCSAESTRDSTSTEEFCEYIFGGSGRYSGSNPSVYSEDSDGYLYSPRNYSEGLSYGERWKRGEEVADLGGREGPQFLYSGLTNDNYSRDCRSREPRGDGEPSVLTRSSTSSRERRPQAFY